jgi:hypothetical protein
VEEGPRGVHAIDVLTFQLGRKGGEEEKGGSRRGMRARKEILLGLVGCSGEGRGAAGWARPKREKGRRGKERWAERVRLG